MSFEARQIELTPNVGWYFDRKNERLLTLFRTLGVRSLRIGGNTSDRDAGVLPTREDIDHLFGFAEAAHLKVIYCLRLLGGNAEEDADLVHYIMTRHGEAVEAFSIGQEPTAYAGGEAEKYPYAKYRALWDQFAAAILAATPNAPLCGPSVHNNGDFGRKFIADFGRDHHVVLITEHLYPGGAGGKVPTPAIGRDRMLGDDFTAVDQKLYDGFVPAARAAGLPYRLEETNNYFNGGAEHVSNTFASALWGLDYAWWWEEHGAAGVNFHTGDRVAVGAKLEISRYTPYFTAADRNGFVVRPLGYALAAFALGQGSQLVELPRPADAPNSVSIYAVRGDQGGLTLTLINKAHGEGAQTQSIVLDGGARPARAIYLSAPGNDVAATEGLTLGRGEIDLEGRWTGKWSELKGAGEVVVALPPATAVVVRLDSVP